MTDQACNIASCMQLEQQQLANTRLQQQVQLERSLKAAYHGTHVYWAEQEQTLLAQAAASMQASMRTAADDMLDASTSGSGEHMPHSATPLKDAAAGPTSPATPAGLFLAVQRASAPGVSATMLALAGTEAGGVSAGHSPGPAQPPAVQPAGLQLHDTPEPGMSQRGAGAAGLDLQHEEELQQDAEPAAGTAAQLDERAEAEAEAEAPMAAPDTHAEHLAPDAEAPQPAEAVALVGEAREAGVMAAAAAQRPSTWPSVLQEDASSSQPAAPDAADADEASAGPSAALDASRLSVVLEDEEPAPLSPSGATPSQRYIALMSGELDELAAGEEWMLHYGAPC